MNGCSPNNTPLFLQLAARVGRTYRDADKHQEALAALRRYMAGFGPGEWQDWRGQVIIADGWNGASGQGAFWAVASEAVKRIASELLAEYREEWQKSYGDELFVLA